MAERVIELGSKVRDRISLFEGTVTARAVHLHGCDRYWVQPTVDKDGKARDGAWHDEQALDVVEAPQGAHEKPAKPGGFPSAIK